MSPERFTVRLDEERAEWVADQADKRDASQAWVLRMAVDAARGADSAYPDSGSEHTTDRLDSITDRLARIEAAVSKDVDGAGANRTDSPVNGANRTDSSSSGANRTADAVESRISELVDGVSSGWDDDGRLQIRRDACRAALRQLYQDGELSKSTALEEIEPEHPVDAQAPESWWRQNVRDAVTEVARYSRGHHTYLLNDDEPRPDTV